MSKMKDVTVEEWEKINEFNRNISEEFLNQQHLSPHTLTQYTSALKIFFRYIHDYCGNKPITQLKPRDALNYQNYLIKNELSSSAVKLKRSAVSSLCGFIELYYSDEYPLFRNIYSKQIPNPPKTNKNEKKPLSKEELNLIIDPLTEREEWQMLVYVLFSYWSGARRSEVAQILKEIVTYEKVKDRKTGEVKDYYHSNIVRCKGKGREGVTRPLVFNDETRDAILKWLEVRGEDDCPFVFVKKSKNGEVTPLLPSAFNYWCKEIFSKIVGRRVHPHQLRSTRATHLVVYDNKDIKTAQAVLGHKSSETTEIYVVRDNSSVIDDAF